MNWLLAWVRGVDYQANTRARFEFGTLTFFRKYFWYGSAIWRLRAVGVSPGRPLTRAEPRRAPPVDTTATADPLVTQDVVFPIFDVHVSKTPGDLSR
jgi:hypothetical protein